MPVALDHDGSLTSALGIQNEQELEEIPEDVFFARFISLLDTIPEYALVLSQISIDVVGSLLSNDGETGYVVYMALIDTADIHFEKLYVVALGQHEGTWRLMLKGALENLAPSP